MIGRILGLTIAFGAIVVVSWIGVRGLGVFTGPGPFLDPTWFTIWAIQVGAIAAIGLAIGRLWGRDGSVVSAWGLVVAAWLGELLVVTLLGPLLADDLSLSAGPWLWLIATGGVVQPIAGMLGASIGAASVRTTRRPAPG